MIYNFIIKKDNWYVNLMYLKFLLFALLLIFPLISKAKAYDISDTFIEYYKQGAKYYYAGQYDLALKSYNKAIKLNPNFAQSYAEKGLTLSNLKQFD
ncbi:tetratricopeptide repeat protein [Rickettsia asembonensis]|uniref:Uncharacterized protein n=2 Tax=Rickettsia asembonensis TaxID=1068590 RepID=A0A0C2R7P2_9RICK|nr:tetratricopeptide repeat protein [Rickettsia asembonensis]KIJ88288.1 hypothetical protein SB78_06695 [Rickettsia asembonensis]WCR57381.1 MAG: hypothetical protein PG979_001438 [Rickettsia asembonensis]